MSRAKSAALQRSNCLQPAEHADDAIVFACVRNCVDMRSSSNGRDGSIAPRPSRKNVSDGILADYKPGFFASGDEPCPRAQIRRRKNNSRYCRSFRVGNACQLFDLTAQEVAVDFETHRGELVRGCRFQSL